MIIKCFYSLQFIKNSPLLKSILAIFEKSLSAFRFLDSIFTPLPLFRFIDSGSPFLAKYCCFPLRLWILKVRLSFFCLEMSYEKESCIFVLGFSKIYEITWWLYLLIQLSNFQFKFNLFPFSLKQLILQIVNYLLRNTCLSRKFCFLCLLF